MYYLIFVIKLLNYVSLDNHVYFQFRVLELPPSNNAKYQKNVKDAIDNARILREQMKQEDALKSSRKCLVLYF